MQGLKHRYKRKKDIMGITCLVCWCWCFGRSLFYSGIHGRRWLFFGGE
jgi:hypothetical protein